MPRKTPSATTKRNGADGAEEMSERWCYERIQAVSQMNIDRHHGSSGQVTPSCLVLEMLLLQQDPCP